MGFFVNPYINIDMKHIQYYNRINKNKAPQLTLQRYIKVLYTGFTRLCPTKTEPGSIAASTCSPKQKWSAACLWADNVQTHPHLFSSKHGVSLSLTLLLWPIYFLKKPSKLTPYRSFWISQCHGASHISNQTLHRTEDTWVRQTVHTRGETGLNRIIVLF